MKAGNNCMLKIKNRDSRMDRPCTSSYLDALNIHLVP